VVKVELTCDVCEQEPAVGVCCVPGVPISMAYGAHCLAANAHPLGILVANTACCGGDLDHLADWWQEMVTDTLAYLGKTKEWFEAEVTRVMAEMAEAEAELGLPGPPVSFDFEAPEGTIE
jgi:hypothetical protein